MFDLCSTQFLDMPKLKKENKRLGRDRAKLGQKPMYDT